MNDVPADFWEQWEPLHKDFGPLKSGAIFVAKDKASGGDMAKDFDKTGFEPIDQKSNGVVPADKA